MAYNVFGNPITNSTLVGMSEYKGKNIITRRDRAYVALKMKNVEEKDKNAREYVEKLKEKWGAEIEVCTLCLIYNATGDVISLVNNHDWYGQIGAAPFPLKIENGQWGGFLHCKAGSAPAGSHAAVVYRGLNNTGLTCDWMAAWSNPFNRKKNNMVYTEIRERDHYSQNDNWKEISELLHKSTLYRSDEWNGCISTVSTGSGPTAIFEAIFTLEIC